MAWRSARSAVLAAVVAFALSPASAEEPVVPRIAFEPALDVTQTFRVKYGRGDVSATPDFAVSYKLAVTPVRDKDGYRLRMLVSEVDHPPSDGMDMVVAAALMLDGLPYDILVDSRGFIAEAADWPNLQRELQKRADALPIAWRGVARSVPDGHNAQQVAWHLARSIEAMNFARSYLGFAKVFGPSTVTWHGGLQIDVIIDPPQADKGMAISWAWPSGEGVARESQGRGIIRGDGFAAPLTVTKSQGGRPIEFHEITAVSP